MAEAAAPGLRVGFVGLGNQGAPMAERIVGAGMPLSVFARRPDVLEHFRGLGASPVATLRELAEASDVIGICVRDDEQVREVVLGDNLLAGMRPGGTLL